MAPSEAEIRSFLRRQIDLWNEGKHDEFVDVHREIAPEGFSVENPVGTPPREGWEALEELWRNYQPITKLAFETVITSPSGEAAVLELITATVDGQSGQRHSLHTYDFSEGRLRARYYVAGPAQTGVAAHDRLNEFLPKQVQAWNDGDRDGCINLYREVSGGAFHLEYPLGTPEVPGWKFLDMLWDELQPTTKLYIDHLAVADSGEAAMFVRNDHVHDGVSDVNISIETYRLADDGLHVRYFSQAESS